MPMRLYHGYYSPQACRDEPEATFIYGDNFQRYGRGKYAGQAIIRDMPNALGLAVKHEPKRDHRSYLSNDDIQVFINELHRVHEVIAPRLRAGGTVYWPADGLGTGLAEMPKRAPLLYKKLCAYSSGLFRLKGDTDYISAIVCGGTKFNNDDLAHKGLGQFLVEDQKAGTVIEIIQGGAGGADRMAADWATLNGSVQTPMKVNFKRHGYAGIEILNHDMATRLEARRDQARVKALVIGMPGGKGTAHMLSIAHDRGFEVLHIGSDIQARPASSSQASFEL
ncbi:hypothetical protein LCGC14_0042900 [marine sediment metagenome]|uniref:DUF2493 domain-containing protein n=2 Tax=root TaxID=1 RepID=A0A7V1BI35_9RHOB|nr:SLOG family protein [Sulfitobacter litoralis]HDZ53353.1 DUF2493 domain-containing protein [Sulfitobacter litoralis]